jgi:hypothetical protein
MYLAEVSKRKFRFVDICFLVLRAGFELLTQESGCALERVHHVDFGRAKEETEVELEPERPRLD